MNSLPPPTFRHALVRTVNRWGHFLATSRLGFVDFDLGRLLNEAIERAGLDDFGDDNFLGPLAVLLESYQDEAQLNLMGRIAMRQDILQTLVTRLQVAAERKRDPAIAAADIESPIFIVGLPRSGTTFLHDLVAQDPGLRTPAGWEVMFPSPPPGGRPDHLDPRVARAQRRMEKLYWLAPGFDVIHPMDASAPQECIAIMSYAFTSDAFPTMCYVPRYQRWLNHADLRPAYRYHHDFLQHLQGGHKQLQWVLKAPAHLFGLRALLQVYPDARVIHMHRDPLQVLPSLANLTLSLRAAFSDRHDPRAIGREVTEHWADGLRQAREVTSNLHDRQTRCLDISYDALTQRPIDTIARVYRHFGLELSAIARRRMETYVRQHPKDRYGKHRYSLTQFDLDAAEIGRTFDGLETKCV